MYQEGQCRQNKEDTQAMQRPQNPSPRVMLWAQPRSRSTVFQLSMASVPTFKVYHEPYAVASLFGSDRQNPSLYPELPGHSYLEVINMLQTDYPGKTAVFAKDFAIYLRDYNDLPAGYIHTFLIQNPERAALSLYRLTMKLFDEHMPYDKILEVIIRELDLKPTWDLYKYVTQEMNQKVVIISSDDLAKSPREVVQKYCKETGLPFHESMLNWKPGNISWWAQPFREPPYIGYYTTAISSSCFLPPSKSSTSTPDGEYIPTEVLDIIQANQPLYDELYKNRLTV
ncbi:uncharacterized protein LOC144451004 [Glandiceps talaboti]